MFSFSHHVRHSKYNSTLRAFLQANSCMSLSKFWFRNSLLSLPISDKQCKRCCDTGDLSSFFICFSFENDFSPLLFEHIKQRHISRMIAMFGKSDIRFLSWINWCINGSCDSSPCFSLTHNKIRELKQFTSNWIFLNIIGINNSKFLTSNTHVINVCCISSKLREHPACICLFIVGPIWVDPHSLGKNALSLSPWCHF